MDKIDACLEHLKYHKGEKFWIAGCSSIHSNTEIYIQGNDTEVSQEHLLRAKNILAEYNQHSKLALDRMNTWLKVDYIEKLILSRIHVFDDIHSVTAYPTAFVFTYEYGENAHTIKDKYLFTAMYSVKFMGNGNVLSAESWFA